MSTDMPLKKGAGYLGSKGKKLFRRVVWMLILLIVFSLVVGVATVPVIRSGQGPDSTAVFISSCILALIHVTAWLMILLPYGLYNRIKAFKIMFFIVAGAILIGACARIMSPYVQELFASGIYTIVPMAAWTAFIVVVLCHPRTGRLLKKATILMMIGNILSISLLPFSLPLFQSLIKNAGNAILGLMVLGFLAIVALYYLGSQIYFLWAMALSEMNNDNIDNVTEQTV